MSETAAGGLELRPEPALEAAPDFLLAGCFCTKRTGYISMPKNIVQTTLCCRFLLLASCVNVTPSLVSLLVPVVAPSSPSIVQECC